MEPPASGFPRRRRERRSRRLVLGAGAAVSAAALVLSTVPAASAAPEESQEPAVEEELGELEQLLRERESDAAAPEDLHAEEVPDDVSVEEAEQALEASEELTAEDLRYAAATEDLADSTDSDFYTTPATLPAEDGALIRQEESTFYLDPVGLIEHDAEVTRIMYRTTDSNGGARAAVATVLEPARSGQDTQRPLVIHAPGTQGLGDQCAPSRQLAAGTEYEGVGIAAALEAGYAVVVPDYIGLGTEGAHTYMNRVDQAHAVLDAARAAQQAEGVDLGEENPVHIRGYSQGGGASAAALEIAHEHAPELNLISGAAGAVPADLFEVADMIDSSLYNAFLLFALGGLVESEGLDPAEFLNEEGLARLEQASGQCTVSALISHMFVDTSTLTVDGRGFTELIQDEPFFSALVEQRIGEGRAPQVPVQVNHSLLDDVIPYRTGRSLAQRWCGEGARVAFESNVAPTHVGGFVAGMPGVALFTTLSLNGWSTANSCWRL
ncbi:lipase family protein [Nesterenkonia sp. HG001]|uniref:lipase family protein n=1 Tax=Nesterenkonia sp. HG001 TaxID=2983207 RepID=UPI002AC6DC29|nr:lipase family protein [Nesterenkonia sp. HG001]MDZ5079133.1 lipase family protein [Nesterenkonia sp. HG001]